MDDLVNAIEFEVKQEIANRYFGFRSGIEEEKRRFQEKLQQVDLEQLDGIRLDLHRMLFLLHREDFRREFLELVSLTGTTLTGETPTRQPPPEPSELFAGLKGEGFSRWRRFRNLSLKIYQSLVVKIAAYRRTFQDLSDEHAEICASIDSFHRNNDLSGILGFLRTFNSAANERGRFLHNVSIPRPDESLGRDLMIPHPSPVIDTLPDLHALPPAKQIQSPLTALLKSAFACHSPAHSILPI